MFVQKSVGSREEKLIAGIALTVLIPQEPAHALQVRLGFGLHVGWAIEGAIGSEYKIDASYLSPNVNMASRLEAATKQYGVSILLSEDFVCMLSASVRDRVRQASTTHWLHDPRPARGSACQSCSAMVLCACCASTCGSERARHISTLTLTIHHGTIPTCVDSAKPQICGYVGREVTTCEHAYLTPVVTA